MKLCDLRDNDGARRKKRLLGRGVGSGLGKTCGRGGKGQTARSGVRLKGFQGGQTPLSRRLPKRGFVNIHRIEYAEVNLWQIQAALESGALKPLMTAEDFMAVGFFKNVRGGVRLLGKGEIKQPIQVSVTGITASARAAIEKAGGTVTILGQ